MNTIIPEDPKAAFIEAACVPLGTGHATKTLEFANAMLADHPDLGHSDIHVASVLGDDESVTDFLALDGRRATAKGGPRGWDPLTYLCFSNYLRLDRGRSDGFLRAAKALLDAGASPNTGFTEASHQPHPAWESALYGAAGVAHNAPLTRLLLERGAFANDDEATYHTPEGYDNGAMKALVDSGALTEDSMATLLLRKIDWHDLEGIQWLLERGADPNQRTRWLRTPLQHAVQRDNSLAVIDALFDRGADPTLTVGGASALSMAIRRGRGDILESCARRGFSLDWAGIERLIAACAANDAQGVHAIATKKPEIVRRVVAEGATLLAQFAGNGNSGGVRHLLELGVPVTARWDEGDGYFGIAPNSMALHVAAWRAQHAIVLLLIERGAPVDAEDGKGRTPLALAVRACVDSYWADRRTPESIAALLRAGATTRGVRIPTGYSEADQLLNRYAR